MGIRNFDFSDFLSPNFEISNFHHTVSFGGQSQGAWDPKLPSDGSTMVPFSPLVTFTSPHKTCRLIPRPPSGHTYLFTAYSVTSLLQVSQEIVPTSKRWKLLQLNIHLQPCSVPKNVVWESFITSSDQQSCVYRLSLAHSVTLISKTKLTPPPSSPSS
jgi:hypothetical protein